MLKHRKKIDILERYCGVHADQFEWTGNGRTVSGRVNGFRIDVSLTNWNRTQMSTKVTIDYYPIKTGITKMLFQCLLADPAGQERCEKKLGALISALTPDIVPETTACAFGEI